MMIEEVKSKIKTEIEQLRRELETDIPKQIATAREHGDLRENAEYSAALERRDFTQAKITHLAQRLEMVNQLGEEDIPADSVGLGSRVTILDLEDDEEETIELVLAADNLRDDQMTMGSPFGRALKGRKEGEMVTVKLPFGERKMKIIKLQTIHQITNA